MPDITITISASTVAWYAAIVATLSLAMNGLKAWRDRARIVVTARAGYRVSGGGAYDPNKDYIVLIVYNKGRRPKTIENVGLRRRTGKTKYLIAYDSVLKGPQELAEGRSFSWMIEQEGFDLDNIEYAWALDQTGKYYRGKLEKT